MAIGRLLHDDFHQFARLHWVVGLEAVQHPEAVELAVDQGHARRQMFDGVAGLDLDDLQSQRLGRLDLREAEPAEGADGLTERALGSGVRALAAKMNR